MRYVIITDPVGRILGLKKRDKSTSLTDTGQVITALNQNDQSKFKIQPKQVAKINDCPYIMIFAEDTVVLSTTTIWLR